MTGAFNLQLSVGIHVPGKVFLIVVCSKKTQVALIIEFPVWNSAYYRILSDCLGQVL